MSNDIDFVDGLTFYPPNDKAPDFVIGNLSINRERIIAWLNNRPTDEKGYLRVSVKKSKGGKVYCALDTWKPKTQQNDRQDDPTVERVRDAFGGQSGGGADDVPF